MTAGHGDPNRSAGSSFTLIEVALAVAIFAGVIVTVLGLLGPSLQRVGDVLDSSIASRIVDGVEFELERVGMSAVVSATSGGVLRIVASGDGTRVILETDASKAITDSPPGIPEDERYFLIEVSRLQTPAYSSGDGYIGLSIQASWPFRRVGTDAVVPIESRSIFVFTTALTR